MNDPLKPREEHDSHKFYPDLHYSDPLPIFINTNHTHQQPHQHKVYKPVNLNKPNYKRIPKEILPTENIKIPQKIIKLGYKQSSLSENTSHKGDDTYIRELDYLQSRDINILSDISQNQIMFKSLYDMDEQDNYLLAYLKDQGFTNITHEIFECCLTILENEWFQLELKIPPKLRQSNNKSSGIRNFVNLYGSDDGIGLNESIDDQNCSICNDSECDNSNAIIFCDGCDIAVHQDCYGVLFIPEGQWLCRKCMINKNKKIKCQFCPSSTGAFKQTANGHWAHVVCGLWIPELYFASINHMEPIEGIELVPKGRWKLNCYICKQKVGACIQCANKNCFTAFHVTCAKRSGLYMNFKKGVQGAVLDNSTMTCFCEKHGPPTLVPSIKENLVKTRLYFDYIDNLSKTKKNIFKSNDTNNNTTTKKWKTSKGTPLGPNYFIHILTLFLKKFKIIKPDELAQILTKYWSMKREMKRGAPLIRRVNSTVTGGNPNEIPAKLEFSKILLDDLKNLTEINNLITKRETLKLKQFEALEEQVEIGYFSHFKIIENFIEKILRIDSTRFLLRLSNTQDVVDLDEIVNRTKAKEYSSVNEFISDLSNFFQFIEKRNNNLEIKSKNRILRDISSDLKTFVNWNDLVETEILKDFEIEGTHLENKYRGRSALLEEDLSDVETNNEA